MSVKLLKAGPLSVTTTRSPMHPFSKISSTWHPTPATGGLEFEAACDEYRRFYNDTRPHEALAFEVSLSRYLVEPPWPPPMPPLSEGESVQIP
jgi:transposase InsO family protein